LQAADNTFDDEKKKDISKPLHHDWPNKAYVHTKKQTHPIKRSKDERKSVTSYSTASHNCLRITCENIPFKNES